MKIETIESRKRFVDNLKRMRGEIRECLMNETSNICKGQFTKEELKDLDDALTIAILTMWLG